MKRKQRALKLQNSSSSSEKSHLVTMSELPEDLVEEILCRVPATSLKRSRLTCKLWNCLFKDDTRRFAEKHSGKAAKQFLVLLLTKSFSIYPLIMSPSLKLGSELKLVDPRSKKSYISQVFHCDGLLLCIPRNESRIVVWNPCTCETMWIKPGDLRNKGRDFALGYYYQDDNRSPCSKSYKILKYCRESKDSEIYEFSSNAWRNLDDDIAPGWSLDLECSDSVSLKGKVYMFATDANATKGHISLLRFDFSTEKSSGTLPLPYQRDSYKTVCVSVVREMKLSVLLQREITSKTEIWLTDKIDETKPVSWSMVLALDLSPKFQMPYHGSFLLDEDKKAVMCCQRWIDPDDKDSSTDKVYIVGEDNSTVAQGIHFGTDAVGNGCGPAIISYVPSLVQIKPARRKRTRADYRS